MRRAAIRCATWLWSPYRPMCWALTGGLCGNGIRADGSPLLQAIRYVPIRAVRYVPRRVGEYLIPPSGSAGLTRARDRCAETPCLSAPSHGLTHAPPLTLFWPILDNGPWCAHALGAYTSVGGKWRNGPDHRRLLLLCRGLALITAPPLWSGAEPGASRSSTPSRSHPAPR